MNFNTVNRTTVKEVKSMIDCVASERRSILVFCSSPDRRLEVQRAGIASLKAELARREKQLAHDEALLVDHTAVIDSLDARLRELNNMLAKVGAFERIQRLRQIYKQMNELKAEVGAIDPELVDEEMIVS